MKRITFSLLAAACLYASPAFADLVEEEPSYPDNTGALATSQTDTTANILENEGQAAQAVGTKEGEITLLRTTVGVDVYSGPNKVESIPEGSEGWVGQVFPGTSAIEFRPTGRPQLECPAQSLAGWFGPCKVSS